MKTFYQFVNESALNMHEIKFNLDLRKCVRKDLEKAIEEFRKCDNDWNADDESRILSAAVDETSIRVDRPWALSVYVSKFDTRRYIHFTFIVNRFFQLDDLIPLSTFLAAGLDGIETLIDAKKYNDKFHFDGRFYPGGTNGPLIGDYVIIKSEEDWVKEVNNLIGFIVDVDEDAPYNVFKVIIPSIEIDNQPKFWFTNIEIFKYSKNKEELELYVDANKYNL